MLTSGKVLGIAIVIIIVWIARKWDPDNDPEDHDDDFMKPI